MTLRDGQPTSTHRDHAGARTLTLTLQFAGE